MTRRQFNLKQKRTPGFLLTFSKYRYATGIYRMYELNVNRYYKMH